MSKLLAFIDGKKTYIFLFLAGVIYSLNYWEIIDPRTYEYLMTLDTLLIGGSVRSALKKIEK